MKARFNSFITLSSLIIFVFLTAPIILGESYNSQKSQKHPLMTINSTKRVTQLTNIPNTLDAKQILKEFSITKKESDESGDCGLKALNEYFAFTEAGLSLAEFVVDLPILEKFNEYSGNICLLYSLHQISKDIFNGKKDAATLNLAKELTTYSIGKWGSTALKISNVGIFLIDYSLNKFGTQAVKVRKGYDQARYDEYNRLNNQKRKNIDQWKKYFSETIYTSKEIKKEIDSYVGEYIKEFFDNGGEDISEKIRKELMDAERIRIYKIFNDNIDDIIKDVDKRKEEDIYENMNAVRDLLNKEFSISVNIFGEDYANLPIRVVVDEDKNLWQGVTKSSGTWNMKCTYAGYIAYKKPTTVELLFKGKVYKQTFKVKQNGAYVTFDLRNLRMEENTSVTESIDNSLTGTYEGTITYKDSYYETAKGAFQIIIKDEKNISFKSKYDLEKRYYDTTGDGVSKPTGALISTTIQKNVIEGKGEFKNFNINEKAIRLDGKLNMETININSNASVSKTSNKSSMNWYFWLIKKDSKLIAYPKWLSLYNNNYPWTIEVTKVRN